MSVKSGTQASVLSEAPRCSFRPSYVPMQPLRFNSGMLGCMSAQDLPSLLPGFFDCGCPDIYFCPTSQEVECPRHSGFTMCCDAVDLHIPARTRTPAPD